MNTSRITAQARVDTPLGTMTAAATEVGLAGLWFDGQAHHPGPLAAPVQPDQRGLKEADAALKRYFRGDPQPLRDLPLDPDGTPFQRAVWQALRAIPAGETRSYAQVAAAAGRPAAARVAGAAIGRNPISVLVPCHRVVGKSGELTGYAGGLERKRDFEILGMLPAHHEVISVPAGRCVATDPSGKAQRWQHPKGHRIPLIGSFAPEIVASSTDSITTRIELPFEVGDATAEAVCIAADISVGPPVGRAVAGRASLPNPNLALRFCGTSHRGRTLQSRCRLVQIHAGLARTEIEVGSDEVLLATGTSMTTCLPPGLR